jgi:23S rRNA (cytosine1962-C5)-methyltransferase
LDAAQRNFAHNQHNAAVSACHHKIQAGDAFERLQNYAQVKQFFDIVIIDPPAFAKRQAEIDKAIAAYQRLTRLGIAVLESEGVLVQSSCSSRVSAAVFYEAVHQAARQISRPLKEIERTGHALDHPIGFPEGEYLKCMFATL